MVRAPSRRQRFNVLGALHAITHQLIMVTNDSSINSASVGELLEKIARLGLTTPITVIMDNARYQRCRYVLELAARLGIEVLFLPPYSPNLNLIELALTTGMRRGELLALQWADIDGVGGILQVRRTITRLPNRGFVVSEPKTTKSRRAIQLTELAIDALKRHRIKQHETRLKAGVAWQNQNWVFCTDESSQHLADAARNPEKSRCCHGCCQS